MNIEIYERLTGKTVPESKRTFFEAQLRRAQSKLETLLGYTLTPKALYTELGKSQVECVCPDIPQSSALLPADSVRGIIKVFPYNSKDKYLHIDPFNDVYSVKLVRVESNRQFITYKTFDNFTKQYMSNGIGNHIEKCETCFCNCDCKDCVQLAVDADWVDLDDEELPDDLLYLLCDMADYYGDPDKDIQSESVDGHSWSRKSDRKAPEEEADAQLMLRRYAGPFGSVIRIPTV